MQNSAKSSIARESKALVALAFRNGPIEDVHGGKVCPTCDRRPEFGRISQSEMKAIMKYAVNELYRLLILKGEDPPKYDAEIRHGSRYAARWDEPDGAPNCPQPVQPRLSNGVLLTVPLGPLKAVVSGKPGAYSFAQLRNRLNDILSLAGTMMVHGGLAEAQECKLERNRLNLLLAGGDVHAIARELNSYLAFFDLPGDSKLLLFSTETTEPEELQVVTLNLQNHDAQ